MLGVLGGMSLDEHGEPTTGSSTAGWRTGSAGCTRPGCSCTASTSHRSPGRSTTATGTPPSPCSPRPRGVWSAVAPRLSCSPPTRCTRLAEEAREGLRPAAAAHRGRHGRRDPRRRSGPGGAARDRLHDGAGLLHRPARGQGPRRARARRGTARRGPPDHLRRACASTSCVTSRARSTARSSPRWSTEVPVRSSSGAPRSHCSSRRRTAASPSTTAPASMRMRVCRSCSGDRDFTP